MKIDDIIDTIKLPSHIKDKPWLEEFYGKLSWSVKAYATGVLGWYDGNPTNLGNISSVGIIHLIQLVFLADANHDQ